MPHVKPAFEFLDAHANEFKELVKPLSLLYIGWRHDGSPWWYDKFGPAMGVTKFGVLEIFPKNVADLEMKVWDGRYNVAVIEGDARKIAAFVKPGEWDVIYWDHGPEHVTWEDLKECTPKLFDVAGKMLLYSAPWGDWPQGMEDGNEHEVHRNSLTLEQFQELGFYNTACFGGPSQTLEGELCGWMIK